MNLLKWFRRARNTALDHEPVTLLPASDREPVTPFPTGSGTRPDFADAGGTTRRPAIRLQGSAEPHPPGPLNGHGSGAIRGRRDRLPNPVESDRVGRVHPVVDQYQAIGDLVRGNRCPFAEVCRDLDHVDALPLPFEDDVNDVVVATRDALESRGTDHAE